MTGLKALRKIRETKGWTQERLAGALGVSCDTVSRWERGQKFPRETQRKKLVKITGIPFHKILADSVAAEGKQ